MSLAFYTLFAVAAQFSPEQKAEIETIVKDYLIANPKILIEVAQKLQQTQAQEEQKQSAAAIEKNAPTLFAGDLRLGNEKGKVTIVEFLDYQCGHCKNMHGTVQELLKNNPDIQLIVKPLPVFGESSVFAAKAVFAAQKQGKFKELHDLLLKQQERLTKEKVLELAKSAGLDTAQLEKDMAQFDDKVKEVTVQAQAIGLQGTPAFIVGSNPLNSSVKPIFLPGAVKQERIEAAIKQVSAAKS